MKKYPQQKYIYISSKPEMSRGDTSLESDSFNEIEEENINEDDIIISDNYFEIPRESEIPPIHIPFNDKEIFPQNKQGLFFCSATKDTDNGGIRGNSNNKEDNFSLKKIINCNKENNRYNNISHLYKNNRRFFISLQGNEESEEDEDIVNNEISVNFVDELNNNNICKKDNQVEILFENNISKIDSSSELSNNSNFIINHLNKNNKDNVYKIKNENLIKKNKINENIKNIIQNINKNKNEWNNNKKEIRNNCIKMVNKDNNGYIDFIDNKENYIRNGQYDTEVKININHLKDNNNKMKRIIDINKNEKNIINLNSNSLNKKFFEIKNSKNSFDVFISKSKSIKNISLKRKRIRNALYFTKKYKIFHKFLCVSVDTSGLYTLDDDMTSLLLNPKITYNYPFNNLENELE